MPPISVMIKPASGNCNMRCRYCFYADEQANREIGSYGIMSFDTMHNLIDKAFDFADQACTFAFQGGEPTLAGLPYFREFVRYVDERQRQRRAEKRAEAAGGTDSPVQAALQDADSTAPGASSQGEPAASSQGEPAASSQGEPAAASAPSQPATAQARKKRPAPLQIHYALQTNGYAVTEEWAKFFAENHFLVGVSLDGTKEIHDRYRLDAAGRGTYQRVMDSLRLLEKYNVDFNILTVITGPSSRRGQKIYSFFKQNGFRFHQYIECLDPLEEVPGGHDYSLTPDRLEQFLKSTFDVWYQDAKAGNYVSHRYFDNLMMMINGYEPESCNMRGVCGVQWIVEADGGMYPCDFYVLDQWRLGNVNENTFAEMDQKRAQLGFIQQSLKAPEECKSCRWASLCRNGCRRNREMDKDGKNYYCSAYKGFFEYAWPRLAELARLGVGRPG